MAQESKIIGSADDLLKSRVDLGHQDFQNLVEQKGLELYHSQGIFCPCRREHGGSPVSDCLSCGGAGFFFINRTKIRGVIQSVQRSKNFIDFGRQENGYATLTAWFENRPAWMDRIEICDGEDIYNENVFPIIDTDNDGRLRGKLLYEPLDGEIEKVYLWDTATKTAEELDVTVDYTVSGKLITFSDAIRDALTEDRGYASVRYNHTPSYYVVDIPKDIRNSRVMFDNIEKLKKFPLNCLIRKVHYEIGNE